MAKEITRGIIAPGAAELSKNAVPLTEEASLCSPAATAYYKSTVTARSSCTAGK